MKDYLLAALLITTSPDVPETRVPEGDEWVVLKNSLPAVAIEWQLMDKREARYIFTDPKDYGGDLGMIRRRYRDLKDAPRIEDAVRFPEREWVNELVRFNRRFRKNINDRMEAEADRTAIYSLVLWETDQLYSVWDAARDARCEFYYIQVRRQALLKLKNLLGEEDYRTATMPPTVPTWRFNELK